jgi:hypothetical protein
MGYTNSKLKSISRSSKKKPVKPQSYSSDEVAEIVREIHPRTEDFEDGDLEERILDHGPYVLKEVNVDSIESEWGFNDDTAEEYSELKTKMPPLVLDNELWIIDGTHRYEALKIKGTKKIMAYVGKK